MSSHRELVDLATAIHDITTLVAGVSSSGFRYTAAYDSGLSRVLVTVTADDEDLQRTFALSVLEVAVTGRGDDKQEAINAHDAGTREFDPVPTTTLRSLGLSPDGTVVTITPNVLGVREAGTPLSSTYRLWWAHLPAGAGIDASVSIVDSATSCTTHGPVDARTGSVPLARVSRRRRSFSEAMAWAAAALELEFEQGT